MKSQQFELLKDFLPEWEPPKHRLDFPRYYKKGDRVIYERAVYVCLADVGYMDSLQPPSCSSLWQPCLDLFEENVPSPVLEPARTNERVPLPKSDSKFHVYLDFEGYDRRYWIPDDQDAIIFPCEVPGIFSLERSDSDSGYGLFFDMNCEIERELYEKTILAWMERYRAVWVEVTMSPEGSVQQLKLVSAGEILKNKEGDDVC